LQCRVRTMHASELTDIVVIKIIELKEDRKIKKLISLAPQTICGQKSKKIEITRNVRIHTHTTYKGCYKKK
jgi:hypothetical protein